MPEPVLDVIAWPRMQGLMAAVVTELETSNLVVPTSQTFHVNPNQPAFDIGSAGGECGAMLWVRLNDEYPTNDFPDAEVRRATFQTALADELEVGIIRCAAPDGLRGAPPADTDYNAYAALALADKAAMRRAICTYWSSLTDVDWSLGSYATYYQGGVGGGWWGTIGRWAKGDSPSG